jgi:hypothetical protein
MSTQRVKFDSLKNELTTPQKNSRFFSKLKISFFYAGFEVRFLVDYAYEVARTRPGKRNPWCLFSRRWRVGLIIQDRNVVSVRAVGVALFINFEEVEGETEMALEASAGAAAEAHVAGSG